MTDGDVTREALRLYHRYQVEFVERLRLCPWAERARATGRVAERVLLLRSEDSSPVLDAIAELSERAEIEVGLLIFPCLPLARSPFERFVAQIVTEDAARREIGAAPFALAAFHPDAAPDTGDAERLIPFIRRTPDPTIQLVRLASLDRVRKGLPEGTQFVDIRYLSTLNAPAEEWLPLRERIARDNLATIREAGLAEADRILCDIRADRDSTYARLGLSEGRCP